MGIHIAIRHKTIYRYDRAIKLWPQVVRLRPAPHSRTKILGYSLNISPKEHFINWMQDPFGNYQARLVFPDLVKKLVIDVEVLAEMVSINPFDFFLEEYADNFPFDYDERLKKELKPYLEQQSDSRELSALHDVCKRYLESPTVDFLVSINQHLFEELDYTVRMEPGVQSPEETLRKKLGSCRDFAWLLVELLRKFGLAARFVSGYLVQLVPDVKSLTGPTGPDKDFTDLHAWAEVFIPGAGWIGLDATSGLFAGEGHIPLACTPHPGSAAPLTGATEVSKVEFEFFNKVERIYEAPRVTRPYGERDIKKIRQLGFKVDEILQEHDVRLTMGGEPTFISDQDMESDQWNEAADGKDKRQLAFDLTIRLKEKWAPKGLIHFGQGKWYPGEPVPRWQYAIYWRKDGKPLWSEDQWIGNPNKPGKLEKGGAKKFGKDLCSRLGLHPDFLIPAYEDNYYYQWAERNLPSDFSVPGDNDELTIERKTILEVLDHGLENPVGFVLPLRWNFQDKKWESCSWKFKRNNLFLVPGNSQMGLRLPLDRLEMEGEKTEETVIPANHFDGDLSLPERKPTDDLHDKEMEQIVSPDESTNLFKTALCLEMKEGRLHLFLPPIDDFKQFDQLIYKVEEVAFRLQTPVIFEGYQPPYHPGVEKLVVAPDPGVIEVNVHPASSWRDILNTYDTLFELAHKIGLGTNKYMIDGRHTGTGGGNHITLGGTSPANSPLLRRPDLLRSMLTFWQNHPSLSYLFSSAFIGPTSQAPRVDEGRPDIIYELEIAFAQLDKYKDPPFWLVDRIFRNLLTDLTGNTHRAEFCIDKLYNPDSQSGRLGILELRGFDMPPHKEMCLVQLLLIRSLVANFWKNPYRLKLIDWGTDLHNKFMMHYYVKEDMNEVIYYLNDAGIDFDVKWMEVFLDFRFPVLGQIQVKGMTMTLRSGIEPWIVLGEEMSSTGTARYVDSSVERIEVMLEDFIPERYKILCNSVVVPLVKTAYKGKYVAAVRYKAWAPPSALHPTIDVNTPLVFDIYDTWNERSIGGCTYHVMHPGGRSYDTFPVNNLEAESRRVARFWEFNHSPGEQFTPVTQFAPYNQQENYVTIHEEEKTDVDLKEIPISKEFPHTLDLRRI